MANYTDQYIQSTLSFLSYSNFNNNNNEFINVNLMDDITRQNFNNLLKIDLGNDFKNFDSTIDFFAKNFEIVNQKSSITNGFSATTYRLKNDIEDIQNKFIFLYIN